jgi:hypothetical protein
LVDDGSGAPRRFDRDARRRLRAIRVDESIDLIRNAFQLFSL